MGLSIGYSQELGQWRWASDTIELTHDKEAHLVGSFGLYYLFRHKEFNETQSILYSIGLGLLKETSDALVPWEQYGAIGGDGTLNSLVNSLLSNSIVVKSTFPF